MVSNLNNKEAHKTSLMGGAATIGMSVIVVKIIGLLYKIPLMKYLGAEGMGYFNSAYEVYLLFCVIATAGLPTALSILISRARVDGDTQASRLTVSAIYKRSLMSFAFIGAFGAVLLTVASGVFAEIIGNSGASRSISAIAPSILFICVISALRGYFQGHGDMKRTAISQVIEAAAKLLLGLSFALGALKRGKSLEETSAFAVLGITVGTVLSCVYLIISKLAFDRKDRADVSDTIRERSVSCADGIGVDGIGAEKIGRELLRIAVPITLGAAVTSITRLFDTGLIMRRLQSIGYPESVANAMYGSFSTLALPFSNLAPSLISGVALTLVPLLSSSVKRGALKEQKNILEGAFRLTFIFAVPASFGISAFSKQILSIIYGAETDAVEISAPLLSVLGISVLFACLITTSNAVLQAYGKASKPIISTLIGAAVKLISGYILIGIPSINIMGAPISTLLCNLAVLMTNYYYICRYANVCECVVPSERILDSAIRTAVSGAAAVGLSLLAYTVLNGVTHSVTLSTLAAILAAVAAYFFLIFAVSAVARDDILMLPLGNKLARLLPDKKRKTKALPREKAKI